MTRWHILGISGGKDSAALFIGDPSVTSRRSVGGFPSPWVLCALFAVLTSHLKTNTLHKPFINDSKLLIFRQ